MTADDANLDHLEEMVHKLKENERRLLDAQKMAHMGHWFWDVNTGKVVWSEEVYKIFRLDPDEFVPRIDSILELSPWPEDQARDQDLIQRALESKGQGSYEQRFLFPDGSTGYYVSTFQGVYDDEDNLVAMKGVVQDITERKRAELALIDSEEQLSMALNVSGAGLWTWDLKKNEVYIDESFRILLGYDEDEIPTSIEEWAMFHHPDEFDIMLARCEDHIHGRAPLYENEHRIRAKDGDWCWVFTRGKVVGWDQDGNPERFLGVAMDITERKRSEQALREGEERYRAVVEDTPVLICCFLPDTTITYVNHAYCQYFDRSPTELVGSSFLKLIPKSDHDSVMRHFTGLSQDNPSNSHEHRVIAPGDEVRWQRWTNRALFNDDGKILSYQSIGEDVTERKLAEENLLEAIAIINRSSTVAITWKVEEGWPVEYVSENVEKVFGYTADEFMSEKVDYGECVHPDDKDRVRQEVETYLAEEGRTEFGHEPYRIITKGGEERTISDWTFIIRNEAGEITSLKGLVEDVTERVLAEEEREKLVAQLHQAQKMEAVGQLAGGIAHDFNNILQAILGFGEIARSSIEEKGPALTSIDEILKAGDRAKSLVRQLLAFSRRQVLEMTYLDLNEVIIDLMNMIQRVIGEHIDLDIIPGHDLGTIRADRGQITQILANLCVNARDAMQDGGTIIIETENVRIDQEYCASHSWATPGRYALLSVTDTGSGMDEETLEQIFEPFFSTKEMGRGTGLGLSTVYGLVRQHEGMINVYSEETKGTTFKIYLPVVERSATAVGNKIEGPVPTGNETILLAEDDELVQNVCKSILEQAGYTVLVAKDGKEALRIFEENADTIDLALLDVVMPGLSGRAVFNEIRKKNPKARVLFASGYSANAIHTNFILDEGFVLIQKPYQRAELLRKVREILDQ